LYAVEREFLSKKLEKPWRDTGRYIGLIVDEVQVQLIVHDFTLFGRSESQLLRN
jgi:hypothetical protein